MEQQTSDEQRMSLILEREELERSINELIAQKTALQREIQQMQQLRTNIDEQIKLDIGGERFHTTRTTLIGAHPESYFGVMLSGRHHVATTSDGYIFIDRDGSSFRELLAYLRLGADWVAPTSPDEAERVRQEFDFYCIPVPRQLAGMVSRVVRWDPYNPNRLNISSDGTSIDNRSQRYPAWRAIAVPQPIVVRGGDARYIGAVVYVEFRIDSNATKPGGLMVGLIPSAPTPLPLDTYINKGIEGFAINSGVSVLYASRGWCEPLSRSDAPVWTAGTRIGMLIHASKQCAKFLLNPNTEQIVCSGHYFDQLSEELVSFDFSIFGIDVWYVTAILCHDNQQLTLTHWREGIS